MRVLLADDRWAVRSALRLLLEQEPGVQVVGEAADATGLLLAVDKMVPDLVLLDWELPGLPMDQLLRLLHYERPALQVIAMSGRPEAGQPIREAAVCAFVRKNEPPEKLLLAVRQIKEKVNL